MPMTVDSSILHRFARAPWRHLALLGAAAGTTLLTLPAMAQEVGRVISSTPIVQQQATPRQVCANQPVVVSEPKTGAGAVIGALAGGGLGNAVGNGGGRAIATMVGVMGGAILGDRMEGGNTSVQNVPQCSTQVFYENRVTGYNVVYEYQGRQYAVQMPNDPGPTVQLQVVPVGSAATIPAAPAATAVPAAPMTMPGVAQPMTYVQPDMAPPPVITSTTYVVPGYTAPLYVAPSSFYGPYVSPYYPRFGVSLNVGGYRGGYSGYRGGHVGHGGVHRR